MIINLNDQMNINTRRFPKSGQIRLFFILLSGLLTFACQNVGSSGKVRDIDSSDYDTVTYSGPRIEFESLNYDFGRVYEGEKVGWYFKYKNSGDKNLLLLNATASCGCTLPDYNLEPLAPGDSAYIKLVFDTSGREGRQFKTVKVESNGKPSIVELSITADIVKK